MSRALIDYPAVKPKGSFDTMNDAFELLIVCYIISQLGLQNFVVLI